MKHQHVTLPYVKKHLTWMLISVLSVAGFPVSLWLIGWIWSHAWVRQYVPWQIGAGLLALEGGSRSCVFSWPLGTFRSVFPSRGARRTTVRTGVPRSHHDFDRSFPRPVKRSFTGALR